MNKKKMAEDPLRFECGLALACGLAFVWSGIAPADRAVWWTEIVWAALVFAPLAATFRLFRFSRVSYALFALWILLQCIGAHYVFERVPMEWLMKPLGLARNPYDRIAHVCVGLFAFPAAELFWRTRRVAGKGMAVFTAVCAVSALAGVWEVVEWLYAAIEGGETGQAFLGSQGDVWDAQKDILCDTAGALFSAFLWLALSRKKDPAPASSPRPRPPKRAAGGIEPAPPPHTSLL